MSFLYIGTFGSFIGYSAAMPLLIKLNFWVPEPAPARHRHLLRLLRLPRCRHRLRHPPVRWLAGRQVRRREGHPRRVHGHDRLHARVLWTLTQLTPNPTADPAIATDNKSWFPWFLAFFLLHLRRDRHRQRVDLQDDPGDLAHARRSGPRPRTPPERTAALVRGDQAGLARRSASIGAIGALGGFLIPIAFASPWVDNPLSATKGAFMVFTAYYVVCAAGHLGRLPPASRPRPRACAGAGI